MFTPALIASLGIPVIWAALSELMAWNPKWRSNSAGQLFFNVLQTVGGAVIDKLRAIVDKK